MHNSKLKDYMTASQREKLGKAATLHSTCLDKLGVARAGKTAKDKANGHVPYTKNRRVWDDKAHSWVKA